MPTSLVLERKGKLSLRDIDLDQDLSPTDVRIAVHTVGVCGSDVHYYTHGKIGPFVVTDPMVLGHEASGTVVEVGSHDELIALGGRYKEMFELQASRFTEVDEAGQEVVYESL